MPPDIEASPEDLKKARRRKIYFLLGGLVLFAIGVALLIAFMFRRDWKAAILGVVAFIWGALLLNQSMRERELEDETRESMSGGETTDECEALEPTEDIPSTHGERGTGEGGGPGEP